MKPIGRIFYYTNKDIEPKKDEIVIDQVARLDSEYNVVDVLTGFMVYDNNEIFVDV